MLDTIESQVCSLRQISVRVMALVHVDHNFHMKWFYASYNPLDELNTFHLCLIYQKWLSKVPMVGIAKHDNMMMIGVSYW